MTLFTHQYMVPSQSQTNKPYGYGKKSSNAFQKRLFVKGLKASTNQKDLVDYLKSFGKEHDFSVELTTNKNKKHRGFAFVTIFSADMYAKVTAIEHFMNNSK